MKLKTVLEIKVTAKRELSAWTKSPVRVKTIATKVSTEQMVALRRSPQRSMKRIEKIGCWMSVLFLMALAAMPRSATDRDSKDRTMNAGPDGRCFVHGDLERACGGDVDSIVV